MAEHQQPTNPMPWGSLVVASVLGALVGTVFAVLIRRYFSFLFC